jgi:hypothetical protein
MTATTTNPITQAAFTKLVELLVAEEHTSEEGCDVSHDGYSMEMPVAYDDGGCGCYLYPEWCYSISLIGNRVLVHAEEDYRNRRREFKLTRDNLVGRICEWLRRVRVSNYR